MDHGAFIVLYCDIDVLDVEYRFDPPRTFTNVKESAASNHIAHLIGVMAFVAARSLQS